MTSYRPEEIGPAPLVRVRATVNLPQLAVGQEALVNPNAPYIAGCLERGLIVPVHDDQEGNPSGQVAMPVETAP